ncbi:LuxR C-terminal-related transcriptional regulator [Sphaerimonospora cavernae]|uniref:LuxR C-terminal-related transcriptional regulator n=1 Tax=Sphaerimonospora cavernae TaxID=1740611 RepID=A0ABV6TZ16_9ACTN
MDLKVRYARRPMRRGELIAAWEFLLDRLEDGASHLVELTGDPGMGKSRFLVDLAELARRRKVPTVTGRPRSLPAPAVPSPEGRVILIDDLHHLGPGELPAFGSLLAALPTRPVLLLVASRPRQMPSRVAAVMESLHPMRWQLAGLDGDELDALGADALCGAHRRAEFALCHGNPRYVRLLVDWCTSMAPCPGDPLLGLQTPPSAAVLLAEFAGLSGTAALVADSAAVLGGSFDADLLAAVAELPRTQVLEALDELTATDLLRAIPGTAQLCFRHPLLRAVWYGMVPVGRRLGAHQRAEAALRALCGPPQTYAFHVERSAPVGDRAAALVLAQAGSGMRARDPRLAAHWFRAALRILPLGTSTVRTHGPLLASGAAAAWRGGLNRLCAAFLRKYDQLPRSDVDAAAITDAATSRAALELQSGRTEDAVRTLEQALRQVADHPSAEETVRLRIELARVVHDAQHAAEVAEDALLAAAGSGDQRLRAAALAAFALAKFSCGALESSRSAAAEASRLLDQQPDEVIAGTLDALIDLGRAELGLETYEPAIRHLARCAAIATDTGQWPSSVTASIALGTAQLRLGRRDEATRTAECAVLLASDLEAPSLSASALALRAVTAGVPRNGQPVTEPADPHEPSNGRTCLDLLSRREQEVAVLVSQGRTNRQIARALAVSHKTVETHLSRIFGKLSVSSRAEIANMVGRAAAGAGAARQG